MQSLVDFIQSLHGRFDEFELRAKDKSCSQYKTDDARKRRRNARYDDIQFRSEDAEDEVPGTGRDELRTTTYFVVVDSLLVALQHRISAYNDVMDRFNVLVNCNEFSRDEQKLSSACKKLCQEYPLDLNARSFADEMVQFASFSRG